MPYNTFRSTNLHNSDLLFYLFNLLGIQVEDDPHSIAPFLYMLRFSKHDSAESTTAKNFFKIVYKWWSCFNKLYRLYFFLQIRLCIFFFFFQLLLFDIIRFQIWTKGNFIISRTKLWFWSTFLYFLHHLTKINRPCFTLLSPEKHIDSGTSDESPVIFLFISLKVIRKIFPIIIGLYFFSFSDPCFQILDQNSRRSLFFFANFFLLDFLLTSLKTFQIFPEIIFSPIFSLDDRNFSCWTKF